jgi:hypoxanthine phosphoribosyltransferase
MICIHGKNFRPYISRADIDARVAELGAQISGDYDGLKPLIIAVLNGSFIFAADLFRTLTIEAEISFIKLSSYQGMGSSGTVMTEIGLNAPLSGRHVIILEDIIDTGKTLHGFMPEIARLEPASIKVVTLLSKPDALTHELYADYTGFEIPNDFVVGYGLDYDGLGRNLPELYILAQ